MDFPVEAFKFINELETEMTSSDSIDLAQKTIARRSLEYSRAGQAVKEYAINSRHPHLLQILEGIACLADVVKLESLDGVPPYGDPLYMKAIAPFSLAWQILSSEFARTKAADLVGIDDAYSLLKAEKFRPLPKNKKALAATLKRKSVKPEVVGGQGRGKKSLYQLQLIRDALAK